MSTPIPNSHPTSTPQHTPSLPSPQIAPVLPINYLDHSHFSSYAAQSMTSTPLWPPIAQIPVVPPPLPLTVPTQLQLQLQFQPPPPPPPPTDNLTMSTTNCTDVISMEGGVTTKENKQNDPNTNHPRKKKKKKRKKKKSSITSNQSLDSRIEMLLKGNFSIHFKMIQIRHTLFCNFNVKTCDFR